MTLGSINGFIVWRAIDSHFSISSLVFGSGLTRPNGVTGVAKRKKPKTNIKQRSKGVVVD